MTDQTRFEVFRSTDRERIDLAAQVLSDIDIQTDMINLGLQNHVYMPGTYLYQYILYVGDGVIAQKAIAELIAKEILSEEVVQNEVSTEKEPDKRDFATAALVSAVAALFMPIIFNIYSSYCIFRYSLNQNPFTSARVVGAIFINFLMVVAAIQFYRMS